MFSNHKLMRHGMRLFLAVSFLSLPMTGYPMGARPERANAPVSSHKADNVPVSTITLKELARIYWPDSNATQLQQEETLKNLLGKKVQWEIIVAQIQRDGDGYLIQGQSDKDMLGSFSYVTPRSEAEKEAILKAEMGSRLHISGIVSDMHMRHMVLKPANVLIQGN